MTEAITLVGGGPVRAEQIQNALELAPRLWAADGGANHLRRLGLRPEVIIGDFDSLQHADAWAAAGVTLHHRPGQDDTDLEKALAEISAPLILGVGFIGGRADHQLAAFHSLIRFAHQRIILLGPRDLVMRVPAQWEWPTRPGQRVSLFPLAPMTVLESQGLRWPLNPLSLAAGQMIGTSNAATGRRVRLRTDGGPLLALVPASQLGSLRTILAAS